MRLTQRRFMRFLADLNLAAVWPGRIPDWLFETSTLISLNLSRNGLTDLPEPIGRAPNLKKLDLPYNPLTRIPDGIWQLQALETLDLAGCPVTEIPAGILRLKELSNLDFDKDKLVTPPPEVAANGLEAIKRYWSQKLEAGADFLAEAKLLIVGEAGAGKTSLAKKILDPGYVLDADEDSTEGINVLAWQFPAGIRVRDEDGERVIQRDFRVNIWDFGGQEIYHSTHQFFLTKRSVYALVTDERKEDTDFEYWLEVVNLLSGGSPLIIVQNRKQGRQQGIDLGALRLRYPNLCGTVALDLADNSGLAAAVAKIRRELEQLPHIGTFIAPQLLTPSQPAYHWDETDNLVLTYEYEVMPKGIVRRLIVALHDLIAPGDCLWRNGAVFEYDASRAEVMEQYRRRLLSIRIRGGDPRVLLGMIDHELAIIHRSYPGIKVERFMPCNCPRCSTSGEPSTFTVSELLDFVHSGDQIQCRASRKLLDPYTLLNALYRDLPDRQVAGGGDAPIQPEVFISYTWGGDGEALVDEVQGRMEERGVLVTRDKSEVRYRDSIEQFMRRIGTGKCVIVILSKEYLQSKYCMFELTEIASRPEFASRVYPIVMPDAAIFDPISRLGYIKYWEEKQAALDEAMREVGQEYLQGIREELDLYAKIRSTIAGIMKMLADMNTLTPEIHKSTDFEQLYAQLAAALT